MRKSGQRVHRRAAHILIPIGQKVRQDRQGTWRSARAGFRRARAQPRPYRLGRDPAFCAALLFRRPGSGPDDLAPLSAYRTRVDSRSRNGFVSLLGVRGWQHHAWRGVVWDRRILPDRQWPHELPNSTTLVGSVTFTRLAPGASGVVRSDILVARNTPQHLERTWEVTPADIRFTDALYPVAQHAMQRGYYVPNRNSTHCSRHQCPYWRRCEQDFGGVVEA